MESMSYVPQDIIGLEVSILGNCSKVWIRWESRGQTGNSPALSTKKQLTNHVLILNANNINNMFRDYSTRTQINRVFYNLAEHHFTMVSYRSLKVFHGFPISNHHSPYRHVDSVALIQYQVVARNGWASYVDCLRCFSFV